MQSHTAFTKISLRTLCFVFLLIPSTILAGNGKKKYPSKLWEISGNGLSKPSYLYGTMHVSSKVAFHLSDSVFIGLKNCDMVALETNPQQWLPDMMTSEFMQAERRMRRAMGSYVRYGFYESAFKLVRPNQKMLAYLLRQDHSMVNPLLFRGSERDQEFEEKTYLDMFIYQAGAKQGKLLMNLENFNETMRLGVEAQIPDPNEPQKESYSRHSYGTMELIEDAYRRGDLDLLDSLQKQSSPSKKYHNVFIVERNQNMVDKMDSLLRFHTIFSAVGAAHLPGDGGMIEMLREKGYTVRAIQADITSKGKKMWRSLIKKEIPLSYNHLFSPSDSLFSVKVPGPMYLSPSAGYSTDYIFTDMTNGAYFSVSRINHYGALHHESTGDLMTRMDSLLFENIPGEILEKTKISKDGFDGFDIQNETRTGDRQRYQVFFTPLEVLVFKMGGTSKFVDDKESNKFFGSIKLKKAGSKWVTKEFQNSGFQLSLPQLNDHKGPGSSLLANGNNHDIVQGFNPASNGYFLAMKKHLIDYALIEDDTFELRQLVIEFGKSLDYELSDWKFKRHKNFPAIEAQLAHEKESTQLSVLCVLKGNAFYLLASTSRSESQRFFSSFHFIPFTYTKPWVHQTDTFGHFNVVSTTLADPLVKRQELTYKLRFDKGKPVDRSYEDQSDRQTLYCEESHEMVPVSFYKFHKYRNEDSVSGYWTGVVKAFMESDGRGRFVKHRRENNHNNVHTFDLVIGDSFSIREIYVRRILKAGAVYSITAIGDSISGKGPFAQKAFETYAPNDTSIGTDYFSLKASTFFKDIWSNDSTLRAQAMKSIGKVTFNDHDAPEIIKVIEEMKFSKEEKKERYRLGLISRLGWREHKDVVPYLKKLYRASEDQTLIQFEVLEALAKNETTEALKAFNELVLEETPLGNERQIDDLFYYLSDSLEIAHVLYPDLLDLAEFDEYKAPVYKLLATLVDSQFIKPGAYEKGFKDRMIRQAKNDLKRSMNAEELSNSGSLGYNSYSTRNYYSSNGHYAHKLLTYSSLLMPFSDEKKVKDLFEDFWKMKDRELRTYLASYFLENSLSVHDSILNDIGGDFKYMGLLYRKLKEIDKSNRLDTSYLDQLELAKGDLFYGYDYDEEEDSLEFFRKHSFKMQDTTHHMFIFKQKGKRDSDWKLQYVVYKELDSSAVLHSEVYYQSKTINMAVDKPKAVEKWLKEELRWLPIKDRPRVENPSSSNRYGRYFDSNY